MSTFKYRIDGKDYEVELEMKEDNKAQVVVNGEKFTVEVESPAQEEKPKVVLSQANTEETPQETATPATNVNTNNALRAPLPGIITEVRVKVGDEVKTGDTLVVLEAMKMANNLDAEKDGRVTAVCVKVGESVMEDAPLVVVE